MTTVSKRFDAIVVGAGFSGMYMLHKLRKQGLHVRVFEAGSDVGGTWYWNRYPGARCDAESVEYSFSFDADIQQEWNWTERFATQPEIHAYQRHVADKLDLRRDIQFNTNVTAASYNEDTAEWTIKTDKGDEHVARFFISAVGCLSVPLIPQFKGLDSFKGELYHTGRWPHEPVTFQGKRVAVIGTGSTGIQAIPEIAKTADKVLVLHRDANYSVPARNAPLTEEYKKHVKENYTEIRKNARASFAGTSLTPFNLQPASEYSEEAKLQLLEGVWKAGGAQYMLAFGDMLVNAETNRFASSFVDRKIREIVKDPHKADILTPQNLAIGARRLCLDTDYYATYNRENVELVDVKDNSIAEITSNGVRLENGDEFEFDMLILATGYDAITGALNRIDITGKGGKVLKEKWSEGPKTYIGLSVADFPNFFIITGPGSPSVFTNMVTAIEQHVEWIAACLDHVVKNGYQEIEATQTHEDQWVAHVNEVANHTLLPTAASWYLGANVPGKPRVFMPYVGGLGPYGDRIEAIAQKGYEGFRLV